VAESRPRRGHGEVRDLVGRNVAALIKAPAGRTGRPSKSLTLKQAQDLLRVAADTKTPKSRRVLSLPRLAIQALHDHLDRQAEDRLLAGVLWQDYGLVFASAVGTALDRHNVLREFRKITQAAGLGTDWVPREMRHTFVSLLSSKGTALEDITDLVGHRGTATTETVYRKVIVPELRRGAEVMDQLFT
jgi:site-specific recombinase XerD